MVRSIMYIADVGGVVYGVDGVTVVCRVGVAWVTGVAVVVVVGGVVGICIAICFV